MEAMKRSAGVTWWAVLLMLGGVGTGLASILSLSGGPRSLDAIEQRMTQQLDALPTGTGQGQLSPEKVTELRTRFSTILRELRGVMSSPTVYVSTVLALLLGLAGLVAGIGLWRLQGWGRWLAICQAGCAVPLGLVRMLGSPQRQISEAVLQLTQGLLDPAAQERMRHAMQIGQVIGQAANVALLLAWNGLLIWFVNRAGVKAQFQQVADQHPRPQHHRTTE